MESIIQQRAREATEIYDGMDVQKRGKLGVIAQEIMATQGRITEAIRQLGTNEICRRCEGACCLKDREEAMLSMEYFLFLLFALSGEEKARVWEMIFAERKKSQITIVFNERGESTSFCLFHDESSGCRIPHNAMPPTCKFWFCVEKVPGADEIKRAFKAALLQGGLIAFDEAIG